MKKKLFSKLAAAALAASMVIGTATTSLSTYAANLNQVTGLSVVERDEDELTLKWKKVAGADGYLLYRYNTNTKKWQKIKTTSKTRYEVEHLKAGTKYHFAVRAYDKTKSGTTYYGPYSATLSTYTAPDEVDNLKVTKTTQTSVSQRHQRHHQWAEIRRHLQVQGACLQSGRKHQVLWRLLRQPQSEDHWQVHHHPQHQGLHRRR